MGAAGSRRIQRIGMEGHILPEQFLPHRIGVSGVEVSLLTDDNGDMLKVIGENVTEGFTIVTNAGGKATEVGRQIGWRLIFRCERLEER